MHISKWFTNLGQAGKKTYDFSFYKFICRRQDKSMAESESGVKEVCSQLCGQKQCRCGASFKGPFCLWNHYRL